MITVRKKYIDCYKTIYNLSKGPYRLYKHQREGLKKLVDIEESTYFKGGMLCDDPGLGKTIQMIALMKARPVKKTLIIVPKSVIHQWVEVLTYMYGRHNIYLHIGPKRIRTRKEMKRIWPFFSIAVTTYGMLYNKIQKERATPLHNNVLFPSIHWNRVILDEGHIIRNKSSLIHKMCCRLSTTHRWLLTGTPIQNNIKDIKSLFAFIGAHCTLHNISDLIGTYVIRRTKKILLENNLLKKYTIINHCCEFKTATEQYQYTHLQNTMMNKYNELSSLSGNKLHIILKLLLRLRQHNIYSTMEYSNIIPTLPTKLYYLIEEVAKAKGLSIIFGHFSKELRIIKDILFTYNIYAEIYDGSLSVSQRSNILDKFQSDVTNISSRQSPTVLIIQIKAGSVGLNLQQFSNVFITSPDWNPCNEIQAISRIHRIGQKNNIHIHKFTNMCSSSWESNKSTRDDDIIPFSNISSAFSSNTTIDELILLKQVSKLNLISSLLNDHTMNFNETLVGENVKTTSLFRTIKNINEVRPEIKNK